MNNNPNTLDLTDEQVQSVINEIFNDYGQLFDEENVVQFNDEL